MKPEPIYSFNENDVVKIKKLPTDEKNGEICPNFRLFKNAKALILWKSGKKIILKIEENKFALCERASEKILASKI